LKVYGKYILNEYFENMVGKIIEKAGTLHNSEYTHRLRLGLRQIGPLIIF